MLAPAPGSLQIDTTLGGGGHAERNLEAANSPMAASSDSTPTPRRSPEARSDSRRFGERLVLRQANFGQLAASPPRPGSRAVDGSCSTSACQLPARRPRAWVRLPDRRSARHALRRQPWRPGSRAAGDSRRGRACGAVPPLRRGAVCRAHRPDDRGRAPGRPDETRRAAGGARRAGRAAHPRPPRRRTRPRASSRPCGSRSTMSSPPSRPGSRRRSCCFGPADAWWCSATTRSRTASSSVSSPPNSGVASARPKCRCASAASTRACGLSQVAHSECRGDPSQSPCAQRPSPGRRACRRLAPIEEGRNR